MSEKYFPKKKKIVKIQQSFLTVHAVCANLFYKCVIDVKKAFWINLPEVSPRTLHSSSASCSKYHSNLDKRGELGLATIVGPWSRCREFPALEMRTFCRYSHANSVRRTCPEHAYSPAFIQVYTYFTTKFL